MTKNVRAYALTLTFGIVFGALATSTLMAQLPRRSVKVTQMLNRDVTGCAGKEVNMHVEDIGPGSGVRHYHPGDSLNYVLEGSQTYQIDGGPEVTMKAGEALYEEPGKVYLLKNTASLKLLIVRVSDKGKPSFVPVESRPQN